MPSPICSSRAAPTSASSLTAIAPPPLAQRAEHQPVAQRARHAQSRGDGLGIRPGLDALRAGLERLHDGRAAARLYGIHPRQRSTQPSRLAQLLERLPHPDETGATAGRIDDRVGKLPAKLLRQLEAERLLSLDAIGLAQRRDVDRAGVVGVQASRDAAVADVAVEQHEIRAEGADLLQDGPRRRCRCVDASVRAGARGVGGQRDTRIAGRGNDELLRASENRACHGGREPACLE